RGMRTCPYCQHGVVTRDGHDCHGRQRFACAGCGRDFTLRSASAFSGYRWPADVILMAVRWYLRHPLSATSVMELLAERGIDVTNRTVLRWVQAFGPQLALKLASIVDHLAAGGMRTRCSSSAARTSGTCSWRAPTAGQRHGRAFAHDF